MFDSLLRKKMNSNFRVKFNRLLVGYYGLCQAIGCRRANHLICKALRSSSQCKRFKCNFGVISFYAK